MKKKTYKNIKIYTTFTILFCIISFAVFAIFIKLNKGFIWQEDGVRQHYLFLYDFNQIMRNIFTNGFPMISWEMGLGLDTIGQYAYYILGDPFAYISLLFPIEYLETIYNALIILRIYCVGLAFIAYCKYNNKNVLGTIVGAISYTFCGFILCSAIRHPFFTNAAILLPLNFIGIEKLLKENKKSFLIFIVFFSAICNYYFFYMIAIITAIYTIIKYTFEYNKGIKDCIKKMFVALGCYILGILMSGVIFIPTIYAFLNSPRMEYEGINLYNNGFYKNFFIGIIVMKYKNYTMICVPSIILLMLPALFTKLKRKEAKAYIILFLIITVMLLLPWVSSFMNGLSFPNNRWVFVYAFILSYIITIGVNRKLKYSKSQMVIMSAGLVVYCLISMCIIKLNIAPNIDFYSSIIIAFLILLVIVVKNILKIHNKIINKITAIIILYLIIMNIAIVANYFYYLRPEKQYVKEFLNNNTVTQQNDTINGDMDNFKEAIEYIKENDKEFYRIDKNNIYTQNVSLIYDYLPIQTFFSIGNGSVYNLSLGLKDNHCRRVMCIRGMDERTKITTLLGTKYFICNEKEDVYAPYGYSLYKEMGNTRIYINNNYLPLGVFYDKYILKDEYDNLSPLQKEDALITVATLERDSKIVKKEENIIDNLEDINSLSFIQEPVVNNQFNITKNNKNIYLTIDNIKPNTELYLSIKNLKYYSDKGFQMTTSLNGRKNIGQALNKFETTHYIKISDFLINLGVIPEESDSKLTVNFDNTGTYTFDEIKILEVPMNLYVDKITKLKENAMDNIVLENNYIKGTINAKSNGILQITTSYSKGWRAFVDGEEVEVIKVNEGFIGTEIEAGEHEIEFKYRTPYIDLGMACTLFGFISFICIIVIEKRNKKKCA